MRWYLLLLSNIPRAPEGEGETTPASTPAPSEAPASEAPAPAPVDYSDFDLGFDLPDQQDRTGDVDPPAGAPQPAPSAEGTERQEPAQAPAAPEPPPTPPVPEAPKEGQDPRDAILLQMQETIRQLTGNAQQPKQQPAADPANPDAEYVAKYQNIPIPDAVVVALGADDPAERGQAIKGLITGILTRAALDARAYMREQVEALRTQVPTLASSAVESRTQAQQIADDFNGSYPHFAKPGLQGIVGQTFVETAQELQQAGKFSGYTPELKAAVAHKLSILTGIPLTGFQAQAPAPAAPAAPAKRPPFATGGTPRPPSSGQTNEFADVLGSF